MTKILCIGDSITYGAWDSAGGWVARLRKRIDRICLYSNLAKFYLTYNLGISSDTSRDLLERMHSTIAAYSKEAGDFILIFSIGTNDSVKNTVDGNWWVSPEEFRSNIQKIIEISRNYSDKILFLGSMPVDEANTQPYRNNPALSSTNSDISRYEQIALSVCTEHKVHFIPVYEELINTNYTEMLFADGVHPNDHGHEWLARKVWRCMVRNRWISV